MFDLPVGTAKERHIYGKFRNFLLSDGFTMIQFSVYSRICRNTDDVEKHIKRIKINAPEKGDVRLLNVTEKQYSDMIIFCGVKSFEEEVSIDPLIII